MLELLAMEGTGRRAITVVVIATAVAKGKVARLLDILLNNLREATKDRMSKRLALHAL